MAEDIKQLREELEQLREDYNTLEHNFDIMSEGYQESLLLYDKLDPHAAEYPQWLYADSHHARHGT